MVEENQIKYYHINKSERFKLSQKACVSESKIKSLLENDFFHYGDKSVIDDFLLEIVNSTSIKKGILKNGKIHFLVTNTIVKKYIEERIYSVG